MMNEIAKKARERSKTHHEEFMMGTGALRMTEHFDLPYLRLKYGSMEATLIHSYNVQSAASSLAVRFSYTDTDDLEYVDFVDEDEILALENALSHLSANRRSLVSRARTYTEIVFVSRSGIRVGMYYGGRDREIGEFFGVEGETVFLHSLDDLKTLFVSARNMALSIKQHHAVGA